MALSIVLLAGALLMVQSFMRVQRLQFGFDAERVLSAACILPDYRYPDGREASAFTRASCRGCSKSPASKPPAS